MPTPLTPFDALASPVDGRTRATPSFGFAVHRLIADALAGVMADTRVEDGPEDDAWLGVESMHPLTWLPLARPPVERA